MSFGEILGLTAGAITTACLVPQVLRVFHLKSAREISLLFVLALVFGDLTWVIYGIVFNLLRVILWNTAACILALALLTGKLKFSKNEDIAKIRSISQAGKVDPVKSKMK